MKRRMMSFYVCKWISAFVVVTLSLSSVTSESLIKEDAENEHSFRHKGEDCEGILSTPNLSDTNGRFLKVYEEALRESEVFKNSDEGDKLLMLKEITHMRKLLETTESKLEGEERELVQWVNGLALLSDDALKTTMKYLCRTKYTSAKSEF